MSPQNRRRNQPKAKPASRAPAKRPQQQQPQARATQPPLPISVEGYELTVEQFSGPIPPAHILASYDEVVPGLAGEIVEMAHDEQRFRHRIVEKAVDANIASEKRGQNYALIIAIVGFLVGMVIALAANPAAGAAVAGVSLATIVGLFLRQRSADKKDDLDPR